MPRGCLHHFACLPACLPPLAPPTTPPRPAWQVYRGSWNGTTVAVKVIETSEPLETFHHEDGGLAPGEPAC